jgi:DNA-binding response OmpR family regulator
MTRSPTIKPSGNWWWPDGRGAANVRYETNLIAADATVRNMPTEPRAILVLADDLIWSSRLAAAVERAGAVVARSSSAQGAGEAMASRQVVAALIDLNGRGYDGLDAVAEAAAAGKFVMAVGQHEDVELRRRALAAGAGQVYSYNRFFREGPALVKRALDRLSESETAAESRR